MHETKIGRYYYPLRAMLAAALVGVLVAGLLAVGVVFAGEARATSAPSARAALATTTLTPYHLTRTAPRGMPYPACVTTRWRSAYWHRPMTRPGQTCIVLAGMWVPASYRLVGYWTRDERGAARYDVWDGLVVRAA